MNREMKDRILTFISDLDDKQLTPEQVAEATALYGLLNRKPGRQLGYKKPGLIDPFYVDAETVEGVV